MVLWETNISDKYSGVDLKKIHYKKKLLKLLYYKGIQANSFLAKEIHVSIPTVQALLNELIDENLISEYGLGNSSGGRRPNMYGLAKKSFYTMGIDIGRYTVRVAIYNHLNESVSGSQQLDIKLDNKISYIDKVYNFSKKVIKESNIDYDRLIGIGVIMPGLIDPKNGINNTYLNFDQPVQRIFADKFGKQVFIENDARARALAELRFGSAKGKSNVLVLHIDWGVGLGMVLDGKLHRGASGYAGEFSHMPIHEQGTLCHCGKHGCLETIASGMALVNEIEKGLSAGKESILLKIKTEDKTQFNLEDIVDAINKGDVFSISLISEMAHHLGKGIATLIQILNPEQIILGGRLSKVEDYLITPIKQSLNLHCIKALREDVDIMVSKLDKDSGVLGAIATVTEEIFY